MTFRLIILWMGILLLSSFWFTLTEKSEPVSMAVLPEAPREGEPIVATFKLNNPSSELLVTSYQFYANGEFLKEGVTTLAPSSGKTYQYAYENPLPMGERLNFVVRTQSELGSYERVISSPAYPPQIWSSFVSFASFSTSVMSSMSTMTYYQSAFGSNTVLNIGLVASIVLIVLLIFAELVRPTTRWPMSALSKLGILRIRLSTVTWILLIIFMGIFYTRIAMLIAT